MNEWGERMSNWCGRASGDKRSNCGSIHAVFQCIRDVIPRDGSRSVLVIYKLILSPGGFIDIIRPWLCALFLQMDGHPPLLCRLKIRSSLICMRPICMRLICMETDGGSCHCFHRYYQALLLKITLLSDDCRHFGAFVFPFIEGVPIKPFSLILPPSSSQPPSPNNFHLLLPF